MFFEMNSQTYVTDPLIWERFYKNMAKNNFNPYKYRRVNKQNLIGRGLHGRVRHSYMIPVNANAKDTETSSVKKQWYHLLLLQRIGLRQK